ncbi:ATP-binding protein [Metabacillus dongyingensis]|uniref:sensor histidine kinase n=1 Tax=Metabacillus dongyingensis TaxID=2874282 RepID=UPI003B8B5BFA
MKINHKIQLFSTVWMLFIVLAINAAIYFLFLTIAQNSELDRLKLQAEAIAGAIRLDEKQPVNSSDLLRAYLPADGMIRIINDQSKEILAVSKNADYRNILSPAFRSSESSEVVKAEGRSFAKAAVPVIWVDGEVVQLEVTENLENVNENMDVLKIVLVIASLLVLLPSFFAGRMLSKMILKPINSLIGTMEEIEKKETFKKIEVSGHSKDELQQMTNTFNNMIDLLQTNFEKQQQFISDASHELKTPLTIIESYAKLLKRWGTTKPEVMEESVEAIYSEAVRMKEMTAQLLQLAENDTRMQLNLEKMDLVLLCHQAGRTIEQVYSRHIDFHFDQKELFISADELKMKQLLFILFDNAMKYSSKSITCKAEQKNELVHLSIADQGIGIPAEDLQHVFDRFFRVDKARNRETGGTGLGLSIARKIVHAHGGEILIESTEGKGTTVHLYLQSESFS